MSIENNLERIATALEAIAEGLSVKKETAAPVTVSEPAPKQTATASATTSTSTDVPTPPAQVAAPTSVSTPAAPSPASTPSIPSPPVATVAATTTAPIAAAQPVNLTADQLNEQLKAEYTRLGNNREPIDKEMRAMGVQSITDLKPEQYQLLLDAVRKVAA